MSTSYTPELAIPYGWTVNEDPGATAMDNFRLTVDAVAQKAWATNRLGTSGLVYAYYGGNVLLSTGPVRRSGGTLNLTANATNYVERTFNGDTVSANTTAFTSGKIPMAKIVTGTYTAITIEDWRPAILEASGTLSGGAGQVAYFNGAASVVSSANFTWDGTNLTVSGGIITSKTHSGATASIHINVSAIFQNTGGTSRALYVLATCSPSAASTANVFGAEYSIDLSGSAAYISSGGMYGMVCTVRALNGAATGTVPYVAAVQLGISNLNPNITMTSAQGLLVTSPVATGPITTVTGILVANQAVSGVATAYAIYTGTGLVHFGDNVDLASGKVYKVNTVQVVGAQGAAVADATDAATAITQLNTLLARLRAHGLIAT